MPLVLVSQKSLDIFWVYPKINATKYMAGKLDQWTAKIENWAAFSCT